MEDFYEESVLLREGIRYPFECHSQKAFEKRQMVDAHWHYNIELLYCIAGSAQILISGNQHEFGVGDLVLINSREIHSIYSTAEEGIKYIVLKFDPNMLYSTSNTFFEAKYVFPFTLNQATHQKIFTQLELENTQNIGSHMDENTLKRLQFIFDYVDKNYMEDISTEMMAKVCKMSYSYFSRFFKATLGQSFTNYLNFVRICEAEKHLISGLLNVTEIALECGFSFSSYFILQFKKHKNLSPNNFNCDLVILRKTAPTNASLLNVV